jgi:hypothetical protein
LEELLDSGEYEFMSDYFRNYVTVAKAEGEARGEARGEAKSVVMVLKARGVRLPDEVRERIMSCTDLDQLERWLQRAITATAVGELFDSEPAR